MNNIKKLFKDNLLFIISVIPLFLYGIYKNIYLVTSFGYSSFLDAATLLIAPFLCIVIGLFTAYFYKNKSNDIMKFSIISSLSFPYNSNIISFVAIYVGVLFLLIKINNQNKINEAALFITLSYLVSSIFSNNLLSNPMEIGANFNYSVFDNLFGKSISFFFTSNLFLLLISYLVLCFDKLYKKEIFVYSSLFYLIFGFVYMLIAGNVSNNFLQLINPTTFFALIYIAPNNISSPSNKKDIIIFSLLISVLTTFFGFICKFGHLSCIYSILISSVVYRIYDRICQNKFLKSHQK